MKINQKVNDSVKKDLDNAILELTQRAAKAGEEIGEELDKHRRKLEDMVEEIGYLRYKLVFSTASAMVNPSESCGKDTKPESLRIDFWITEAPDEVDARFDLFELLLEACENNPEHKETIIKRLECYVLDLKHGAFISKSHAHDSRIRTGS